MLCPDARGWEGGERVSVVTFISCNWRERERDGERRRARQRQRATEREGHRARDRGRERNTHRVRGGMYTIQLELYYPAHLWFAEITMREGRVGLTSQAPIQFCKCIGKVLRYNPRLVRRASV